MAGDANAGGAGNGTGAPAAPGASGDAAAGGTPVAAPAAASAPAEWTAGLPEDHRGFVQNKGWKAPQEVVESYRNLEKLVGAPQDQIIKLPKFDDVAGWDSVHTRLGKPANPDGYGLKPVENGMDEEATKWAASEFHKAGLSDKQGKALAEAFNAQTKAAMDSAKAQNDAKTKEETAALKKEWGAAYDKNMSEVKRAVREFGLKDEVIDKISAASGNIETVKFLQAVGSKLLDAGFHTGNPGSNPNGPFTPEQAKSKIKEFSADPSFSKRYQEGGQMERSMMETLHKQAYPDEQ